MNKGLGTYCSDSSPDCLNEHEGELTGTLIVLLTPVQVLGRQDMDRIHARLQRFRSFEAGSPMHVGDVTKAFRLTFWLNIFGGSEMSGQPFEIAAHQCKLVVGDAPCPKLMMLHLTSVPVINKNLNLTPRLASWGELSNDQDGGIR